MTISVGQIYPVPRVLVGQSIGALNVRLYTMEYGNDVAGIGLLDLAGESSMLQQAERFHPCGAVELRALNTNLRPTTWEMKLRFVILIEKRTRSLLVSVGFWFWRLATDATSEHDANEQMRTTWRHLTFTELQVRSRPE